MTDTRKDGGPAFPTPDPESKYLLPGMLLRDWFAGQALAGIASMSSAGFSLPPEQEASWAYQRADAMIAAREEGGDA